MKVQAYVCFEQFTIVVLRQTLGSKAAINWITHCLHVNVLACVFQLLMEFFESITLDTL